MFNPQDRGIGKGKPLYTVCSRRLNPFFIVTVYVKLVKISRTPCGQIHCLFSLSKIRIPVIVVDSVWGGEARGEVRTL